MTLAASYRKISQRLKFGRRIGSAAADTPAKFQDIFTLNLAGSRLCEILQ